MKKIFSIILVLALISVSGCSEIDYPPRGASIADMDGDVPEEEISVNDKYRLRKFDITEKAFRKESDIGGGQGHWVYEDGCWVFEVDLNSPQHYRIGIKAAAIAGKPVVVLSTEAEEGKAEEHGGFYITAGTSGNSDDSDEIGYYYIEPVYLPNGETKLYFWVYNGNVRFDSIVVENTTAISTESFRNAPSSLSYSASSIETIALYDYLRSQFGSRVLTSQHCTVNTNAEINAVYEATGREPAVRFGEASGLYREYGETEPDENGANELDLARQWHKKGGIVAYTWDWEIDESELGESAKFSLNDAVGNAESDGVALMDTDYLESLAENGEVSPSCLKIIGDIDRIAESFSILAAESIPVLWSPLPDGGSRLHWWGEEGGEMYVKLWNLMYDRMVSFHGLDNLIWVWSGGSERYYPGGNKVDIIGETSFPNGVFGSEAVKLNYNAYYSESARKLAMITASSGLPSPDILARDNAGWLIWSLYKGDFIIDSKGGLLPEVKPMLDGFYNHELTVCLDNLPKF